jgi:mono/diheme cytochrome c family protein
MKLTRTVVAAGGAALIGGLVATGVAVDPARAQDSRHAEGKAVFDHWCAPCHAPGPGHPGTQGLQIKYRDTDIPAELEAREDLTAAVVSTFVRQGVLSMAPFRKTEITDDELAALGAYLTKSDD